MFEDQYVELLPARTTMKAWSRGRRRSVVNIGGDGGNGGNGGAGGLGVNINVNPQVAVFGGENSSTVTQNAGNGGAGGAGGAGGSAG